MGIKNLTLALNEAGKIKIGRKGEEVESAKGTKFRPPERFDHFVLTTTEKNENGDFVIDLELMDRIKENGSGLVNEKGDIVGLPVRLLYNDTDLNFSTRYASYAAGKLSCYGDGEKSFSRLDNYQKEKKCPCKRLESGYDGKDKCKINGKLTCVIDEANLFGQVHTFRTTSVNSVRGILGGIQLIKTATQGKIQALPLMLVVNNKSTVIPLTGKATTVQVVSICYRGDMAALRNSALKLIHEEQTYLLEMDNAEKTTKRNNAVVFESEEEESDFVKEFYPDNIIDAEFSNVNDSETEKIDTGDELKNFYSNIPQKEINILNKLKFETDAMNAMKLAKRLTGPVLLQYIHTTWPHKIDEFPNDIKKYKMIEKLNLIFTRSGAKPIKNDEPTPVNDTSNTDTLDDHPFIVKILSMENHIDVANLVTERFIPIPINRTMSIPELIKKSKELLMEEMKMAIAKKPQSKEGSDTKQTDSKDFRQETDGPKNINMENKTEIKANESPEDTKMNSRRFDTSGQVEEWQLVKLVELKESMNMQDAQWFKHVQYFFDADGERHTSANNFSINQANTFIVMLETEQAKIISNTQSNGYVPF